ncbi:DUF6531 domain-containing protein [Kribbella sp. CA-253562]|uniref:DUF6531 domain-containing protein n=1 Tax=Kribbella sp. CA-253562 TaxID=3239942 RepID=UPI003D8C9F17
MPDAVPTGKGTSYDYRFAGVAGDRQAAVQVTPAIAERGVAQGEVILDKTLTINQNATETLAISRSATGYGAVRVDDVLTVEVTHADGSKISKTLDFSDGCVGWVTPAGPLHLSGVLEPGDNTVRFVLRDGCGAFASADPMYVVPVTTKVSDLATLGSGCDLCSKNPTVSRGYPVNTATGNETKSVTDLQLAGPGTAFVLLRSYNSASDHVGVLGRGWNHAYEGRLEIAGGGASVVYVGIDGQQAGYTRATDGTYVKGTGVEADLVKLADGRFEVRQPNHSVARFSSTGQLEALLDNSGVGLQLAHSGGVLSTVTDAAGRVVRFTHDAEGRLQKVELPDGRFVQYTYTAGLLTGVRDVRGGNTTYAYDAGGRLNKVTDPLGHSVANEYDSEGRVVKQTDPRGKITQYVYDPLLGTTTIRPDGGRWTDHYLGNVLVGTSDAQGGHTSYGYDAKLNLTSTTDPRGNTTTMTYDARGNMLTRTAPAPVSAVEKWTYDSADNVLTYTDGRGNVTTNTYDTANRLTKLVAPDQGTKNFTYTATGQLKTRSTGRGYIWTSQYDADGNLTSEASPAGLTTTMTYDGSGRLLTRTDPRGSAGGAQAEPFTTKFTYEPGDKIATTTAPDGTVASNSYDAVGNLTALQVANASGTVLKSETYTYDAENRPLQTKNRDRIVETLTYDAAGNKESSTDATGAKTTYKYDRVGRMTAMTTPRGNVAGATESLYKWEYRYDANGNREYEYQPAPNGGYTQFTYDVLNRVTRKRTPLGNTTDYTYDGNGNALTSVDDAGKVTTYTYDGANRVLSEALPGLQATRHTYDPDGARLSTTSPSGGSVTRWTYDGDGRQLTQVSPRGNVSGGTPADYTTTFGYDAAGNQTTVKDQLGRITTSTFDGRNNRLSERNPRGFTTSYQYDGLQRLTTVTSAANAATTYTYDAYGDLIERKTAKDAVTKYGYNARGDLVSTVDPLDRKQTYGYDEDGNVVEIVKARGYATGDLAAWTIKQSYNGRGLRTAVSTASAASSSTFTYDNDDRLTSYKDATGTTTQTWNGLNQLAGVTQPQGNYVYTYTDFGAVKSRLYPGGGQADYTFDADGRISSMTALAQTTNFAYDADDNLTKVTYPTSSGYSETRNYDRTGDISAVINQKSGVSTPLSRYDYVRDAARNPAVIKRTRGTTVYNETLQYDQVNRLANYCLEATTCAAATKKITYAYDEVGNRTSETRVGVTGPGTITSAYDAADQMVSRTNQSGGTTNLTYNADGLLQDSREWDVLGRLTKMSGTTFTYDALDLRRTATTTAGTKRMSWDVNNELPMLNIITQPDNSYWRYRYTPDGMPMSVEHPGKSYPSSIMMHDAMGSVVDVADGNGGARWRHAYEPFGVRTEATKLQTVAEVPEFAYTGAHLESTTGEYHLRARDYNLWGMFTAPDPLRPAITDPYVSAYVYADQRPTFYTDPSGLSPKFLDDFIDALGKGETYKNFGVGVVGGAFQMSEQLPGQQQLNMLYSQIGLDASTLFYGATDRLVGVNGTETSTQVGEFFTPVPAGVGIKACRAAAKAGPAVRLFSSSDSHVSDIANLIERNLPGRILDVNVNVKMSNGLSREVDIDMGKFVVEVKGGSARGLTGQLQKIRSSTGKMAIGYAPDIPEGAIRNAARQGLIIVRTPEELLKAIRELE